MLHTKEERHLTLTPFITLADQVPVQGLRDVFLLNKIINKKTLYTSTQYNESLQTKHEGWQEGPQHQDALSDFFDQLRMLSRTEPAKIPSF